jgi:hypothetical protein
MPLTHEKLWRWRIRAHNLADKIAQDDRDLAEDLYRYCDRLDERRAALQRDTHQTIPEAE